MKLRYILDIADECIVKYTASEEWVFTTDELKKFADRLIQECLDECSEYPDLTQRIQNKFGLL